MDVDNNIPETVTHALVSLTAIAAAVRGITGFLKLPAAGQLWLKLPWWAKPLVLMLLATVGGFVDALATNQHWYMALLSAIGGLGIAVTSYEWQELGKDAKAVSDATGKPVAEVKT